MRGASAIRALRQSIQQASTRQFLLDEHRGWVREGDVPLTKKANLFAPHYCSDCNYLLSLTLKLTLLKSYKSVQVGFTGC